MRRRECRVGYHTIPPLLLPRSFLDCSLYIAVSGSKDGTCVVHSLREGEYVRTINLPKASPVNLVAISPQGYIVVYSQIDLVIYLYRYDTSFLESHFLPLMFFSKV
jgi:hypothetical protein